MSKPVWVSPSEEGWKVKTEQAKRAEGIYQTQSEAIDRAREMAQRTGAELIVQNRHGQIREKDSHGHDPKKSKG